MKRIKAKIKEIIESRPVKIMKWSTIIAILALAFYGGHTLYTDFTKPIVVEAQKKNIFDCTLDKGTEVEIDVAVRERAEKICEEGKQNALANAMTNLKVDSLYASTKASAEYLRQKAEAMERVMQ